MEFQRRDRLVELIREQLAEVLREVKDPRLSGFLTITGVDLSPDYKNATAFYSILGSEEDRASSAEALTSAAPFIRHQLRKRLSIKIIPVVAFEYDRTPERAGRVLELLTEIEKDRQAHPPAKEEAEPPSPEPAPKARAAAKPAPKKASKGKKKNG